MNLVWNVKKKLDAQFSNKNHLTLLLNKLSRSQILNPKQALGSCTLKTFYNDKSIAYQIRHAVLQYVWAMTFSKFTASRENVRYLLLPQNFYLQPKEKTQRPVSNPKLCKSCGMSPWSGPGEGDSIWGISPSPGGLHLAPYPHQGAMTCCTSSARGRSFHPVLIFSPSTSALFFNIYFWYPPEFCSLYL